METEDTNRLTNLGLPIYVTNYYASKGVTSLYPWQLECLENQKVLNGRNLLYSAPSSAGKTIVAEILMIKRVLTLRKKAIMILPFISVCREKMNNLQEMFRCEDIQVEGFMGTHDSLITFKETDIAICTIEKANSLINRLLEDNSLSELGTIVVDELHFIGDPRRGYLLELLLTKIKFMKKFRRQRLLDYSIISTTEVDKVESKKFKIQVIGMSATLQNSDLLAEWIDAELVTTNFRPVPLVEHICFDGKIYNQSLEPVRDVTSSILPIKFQNDENLLIHLSIETVLTGHAVLIFCHSKSACEFFAQQIAKEIFSVGCMSNNGKFQGLSKRIREQFDGEKIQKILNQLKQCPGGLEDTLKRTISFGVAYHHAGLSNDERDIIESSYRRSELRVIVATSTLSTGVNLPARRVIISSPMANKEKLDVTTYRQMCGRAGRKGVDTEGESILVCNKHTKDYGIQLFRSPLPILQSALLGNTGVLTSSMKQAILEAIACEMATRPLDVTKYTGCTLLSNLIEKTTNDFMNETKVSMAANIQECLKFLQDNQLINLLKYESDDIHDEYMATQLGAACLASSMSPDLGIAVYKELQKAKKCFVLETDLHIVYQITPFYLAEQIKVYDWYNYLTLWNKLTQEDKKVAELVGVTETFLIKAMTGEIRLNNANQKEILMIHNRFYAALVLNDLINEVTITAIAKKFYLDKGIIQDIKRSSSTFAGMVTVFCGRLRWHKLELLLNYFQEKLQFKVQHELGDLTRLSNINTQIARVLYDKRIKTVTDLAATDPAIVERILHRAALFHSSVHGDEMVQRNFWMLSREETLDENVIARKIIEETRLFI